MKKVEIYFEENNVMYKEYKLFGFEFESADLAIEFIKKRLDKELLDIIEGQGKNCKKEDAILIYRMYGNDYYLKGKHGIGFCSWDYVDKNIQRLIDEYNKTRL